ncbi:hypothetical protein M885DRAFT_222905 [Pelagophyceae sp. CCMP2097]|nr:hypothetical protein M885DRAFT_222905 [Pelagophyceae sp. CCMP2097]
MPEMPRRPDEDAPPQRQDFAAQRDVAKKPAAARPPPGPPAQAPPAVAAKAALRNVTRPPPEGAVPDGATRSLAEAQRPPVESAARDGEDKYALVSRRPAAAEPKDGAAAPRVEAKQGGRPAPRMLPPPRGPPPRGPLPRGPPPRGPPPRGPPPRGPPPRGPPPRGPPPRGGAPPRGLPAPGVAPPADAPAQRPDVAEPRPAAAATAIAKATAGPAATGPRPPSGGLAPPPRAAAPLTSPAAQGVLARAAPPRRAPRAPPPYRPPPGAPPGKPPPRSAPPGRAQLQLEASGAELHKGAPKGRRPPPGAPPSAPPPRPQLALRLHQPAAPGDPAPLEARSDDESSDEGRPLLLVPPPDEAHPGAPTLGAPGAPGAPGEAPPRTSVPPPPADAPPAGAVPPPPAGAGSSLVTGGEPAFPDDVRKILKNGRLRIVAVSGYNVHKQGVAAERTKIDPFLRFTLGKHKKAPRKQTRTLKRQDSCPNFQGEIIVFDVVEAAVFLDEADIVLGVELYDETAWRCDLVGHASLSVLRWMADHAASRETLPLTVPGDSGSNSGVTLEISFEPAYSGMLVATLFEGRALHNADAVGKQDPYVKVSLKDVCKQSKTAEGADPYFSEEQLALWCDAEAWTEDLLVQVFDADVGTDDLMGQCKVCLLPYMAVSADRAKEQVFELFGADGRRQGQVLMRLQFFPAGTLQVHCVSGKNLRSADALGRQDPYVVFSTEGQCSSSTARTHVDQDGGSAPHWDSRLTMAVVDHFELLVQCYDHDVIHEDAIIGSATVSLLQVFKNGRTDAWVTLKDGGEWGKRKHAGDVHLSLEFEGPAAVRFPQHRPGMDSFDESQRLNKIQAEMDDLEANAAADSPEDGGLVLADEFMRGAARGRVVDFTEADIEAAFRFIDLDKNGFVGAAEIRHVLICMGELITDEEVDMMIRMVDGDGDGQVSWPEFYEIVSDPDPGSRDFLAPKDAGGFAPGAMSAKAHERHVELTNRNRKRAMMRQFTEENAVGPAEVDSAWSRYRALPPRRRQKNCVDFETFTEVLSIEPTGETHLLFSLFDHEDGVVDVREFVLGICNYVEMTPAERTKLVFELYDEDRSGYLALDELLNVLKANHMTTAAAVRKKADTILKQADKDGSGTLSRAEFEVVCLKFPTVLFPRLKVKDGEVVLAS